MPLPQMLKEEKGHCKSGCLMQLKQEKFHAGFETKGQGLIS